MILSSRPADRRQLIEEAAGITKYRSRRRAAELKLEAAQQNLVRIDDIVFEVEKQRGTLKRQAAKARRYKRLRDEFRRWEKVLFARRYRELAASIEGARTKLGLAREREAAAAARLAEVETELGRLRLEQTEADSRASAIREDAHARELDINRRQQQLEFNRHQAETLAARGTEIEDEIRDLEARREPARIAMESRRAAQVGGRALARRGCGRDERRRTPRMPRRSSRSRVSTRTSRPRARASTCRSTRSWPSVMCSSTRRRSTSAWARRSPSSTSRRTISAASRSA